MAAGVSAEPRAADPPTGARAAPRARDKNRREVSE
jgi:hypothetical protein